MKHLIYDRVVSGPRMTILCVVSGSGTNYREIVKKNPNHNYVVFTNRPECGGAAIARENGHELIVLSHIPYLREARKKYGAGNVPRNAPERIRYEQDIFNLVEDRIKKQPDLICLAGYDQWTTDWMVDRYYPRILNVHPGDTTKGYVGLHWVPSAKAILAGDEAVRSTLFIVDKGEDTGPVLVQSRPLNIVQTLKELESKGTSGLVDGLLRVSSYARLRGITTYDEFKQGAGGKLLQVMERICTGLQDALKVAGDWVIYPFAVHDLLGRGRVEVDGRAVYVDGKQLPGHGWRMDEHPA
ncbi:MAG: formyltransferase family protein [Dehalococcoidia bacterium]|nr:formyltransferase family protein [Dehalococcoidia bacterium]